MHSTTFAGSSTSTSAPVNPSDNSNIAHLSFSDLVAMSAITLCLHLKCNKLSTVGNKLTIANRIYQLLHPAVSPGTAPPTTTTEPSNLTINSCLRFFNCSAIKYPSRVSYVIYCHVVAHFPCGTAYGLRYVSYALVPQYRYNTHTA